MTTSTGYADAVARNLMETRLHRARPGWRCRCGRCRHLILLASLRSGIGSKQLVRAMPPEPEPEKEHRRPRRRALSAPVGTAITVLRDGRLERGTEALLTIAADR